MCKKETRSFKGRRGGIWKRLIAAFMLIIVVFAGISIYNYILSRGSLKKELLNNFNIQTKVFMDELERDIARVKSALNLAFYDDDISKMGALFSVLSDYESSITINRIYSKTRDLANTSPYISEVGVYLRQPDIMVFSKRPYDDLDLQKYESLYAAYYAEPSIVKYEAGNAYLLSDNLQNAALEDVDYFLSAELSMPAITDRMETLRDYDTSGILVYNPNGTIRLFSGPLDDVDPDLLMQRAENEVGDFTFDLGGQRYTAVLQRNENFDIRIVKYVAEREIFQSLQQFQIMLFFCCLILVVMSLLFIVYLDRLINRPLQLLKSCFAEVKKRNLSKVIPYTYKDEFNDIYQGYNSMVAELDYLINQIYEKQILAQKTELKYLQSQINPHFLYNNFYILHRLIKMGKSEKAEELSKALGQYFQYITRSAQDCVELEQEIRHAQAYVNIQQIRFGERVRIVIDAPPEFVRQLKVPRIILQPLLENAFEHGLKNVESGGFIHIGFEVTGNVLCIVAEDNGECDVHTLEQLTALLDASDSIAETTAIINIHRRLRLLFGGNSGVTLTKGPLGGMRITLRIELPAAYQEKGEA